MLGSPRAPNAVSPPLDPTVRRIADLISRPLLTCTVGTTVQDAAGRMLARDADALVVLDAAGEPVGLLADADLRRAVAAGLGGAERIEAVMSAPVVAVDSEAYFFEALHAMLRHRVHHLLVLQTGKPHGVIGEVDLLAARAQGPLYVARRIAQADDLDELAALQGDRVSAVRLLHRGGVRRHELAQITAETNDLLVRRVLALVEADLGPPPVPYCWLGLGSEGRREQALKTDQDNALLYTDCRGEEAERAARYFPKLAERAVAALERCGLPRCKGGINASNPQWCQPLEVWRRHFADWLRRPEEVALLHGAIFFDLRPVGGQAELAAALWDDLRAWLPRAQSFIKLLLREALVHRPPLGFRGGFHVEHAGEHRGGFDLKWGGLMPIVEPARVFALARGITETNTIARLRLLRELRALSERDTDDLAEAYEFVVDLRIRHHLDQLASGLPPDDHIVPDQLGRVEAASLREHFRVVAQLQTVIEAQFQGGSGG